ncbi:hypothetical protein [Halopiger thermotolerans]
MAQKVIGIKEMTEEEYWREYAKAKGVMIGVIFSGVMACIFGDLSSTQPLIAYGGMLLFTGLLGAGFVWPAGKHDLEVMRNQGKIIDEGDTTAD